MKKVHEIQKVHEHKNVNKFEKNLAKLIFCHEKLKKSQSTNTLTIWKKFGNLKCFHEKQKKFMNLEKMFMNRKEKVQEFEKSS